MAREDTAYTEADIIALKKAMKSGAKSVTTSDGKTVMLNSLRENMALLGLMQRDVYGKSPRRGIKTQELTTDVGGRD